jgi:hypothetical protein
VWLAGEHWSMSFTAARISLTAAQQAAVDALLTAWENGADVVAKQAAANLRADVGMEVGTLAAFLGAIAARAGEMGLGSPNLRTVFLEIGRPFSLAGHAAAPCRAATFGRAVLVENFARYVKWTLDSWGVFEPVDEVERMVRSLDDVDEASAPTASRTYFRAMRGTLLGKNATYATFVKPVAVGRRPWSRPPPSGGTVRDELGLGEDRNDRDYILFA